MISIATNSVVQEETILAEIERVVSLGSVPSGRAAREYYEPGEIPALLEAYFRGRGLFRRAQQARFLGMSTQTLNRIMGGGDISENMLFRFRIVIHRSSLQKHYSSSEIDEMLGFPWRERAAGKEAKALDDLLIALNEILANLNKSNDLFFTEPTPEERDKKKAQLLSLLRELLAKLEAPVINVEETLTLLSRLSIVASRGFENGLQEGSKKMATGLMETGERAIVELLKQRGFSSFDSFF